jgi:hypothetical protein
LFFRQSGYGQEYHHEEIEFFEKLISTLEFDKAVTYWPVLCADAWWVLRARMHNLEKL